MTDNHKVLTEAAGQVLLEVVKLLEPFHESLVLVGGWTPIMLIPEAADRHIGTVDVDLAIDDKYLMEDSLKTIAEILLENNYKQGAEPGRFFKIIKIKGQRIIVPVDFLVGEQGTIPRGEFLDITGLHAIPSPGCELSFEANEKITIEGNLPDGTPYSAKIKSANIAAFIVMKAFAMNIRDKSKDAYDIWFCLASYPGGLNEILNAFRPYVKKTEVRKAIKLLAKFFGSTDDRGPKDVENEHGPIAPEYAQFLRQDSYQRVTALLAGLQTD